MQLLQPPHKDKIIPLKLILCFQKVVSDKLHTFYSTNIDVAKGLQQLQSKFKILSIWQAANKDKQAANREKKKEQKEKNNQSKFSPIPDEDF